jgi:hypothetical protein
MLKPQGYLVVTHAEGLTLERDTISCGHCNRIVFVKPGHASTVYLFPQVQGPDKEEMGAHCRQCDKAICLTCHDAGTCTPLLRRIEWMEARGRFLATVGV